MNPLLTNFCPRAQELKPVIYLKDPEKLRNLEYQLSQPNKKSETSNNQQQPQGPIEELVGPTTSGAIVSQTAPPVNTTPSLPTGPPEPRFNYMDISITGIANISSHITLNNQVCDESAMFLSAKKK